MERNVIAMARFLRAFVIAGATAALVVGVTLDSAAAEPFDQKHPNRGCTNGDLRGTFGFTAQGVTLATSAVPAPLQGAFASSGTSTFDGRGHFTLTATSSFNGIIQGPAVVKGTYDVNDDCTYTSQAENGVTFRAVIVSGGDELLILQTTPGVVISGLAQRQGRLRENLADLSGGSGRCGGNIVGDVYGFIANGVAGPPTIPAALAGPLAGVGTVALDRRGGFTLIATRSINGTLDPEPLTLTGRYTFTEACAFRLSFDVGFTFTATIVDGGDEMLFIETDPGTTLIVRAKRL
jgi:hypothetical protein